VRYIQSLKLLRNDSDFSKYKQIRYSVNRNITRKYLLSKLVFRVRLHWTD